MYKVSYEKESGKILGFFSDKLNYKTIPEPFVEISDEQRNLFYVTEKNKEWVFKNGEFVQEEKSETEDVKAQSVKLKNELKRVLQDIEQERLGIIRDDYVLKKQRAAEIINKLRVLEGKTPREIETAESLKNKYDQLVEKFNALATAHNQLAETVGAIKENY